MDEQQAYRFIVNAYRPVPSDTIPMARPAQYMVGLARLPGRQEQVHFARLEAGAPSSSERVESDAASPFPCLRVGRLYWLQLSAAIDRMPTVSERMNVR